jgi:nuclear GTP-binding protein
MPDKFTRIVKNVIKDADIIIEVLDSRIPLETRSKRLESIVDEYEDKKLILLLNKADLVPKKIIRRWKEILIKEYPTFYTSDRHGFERSVRFLKKILLQTIDKRPIRVCLFGYPNVGKSSIINALRGKKVAPTSPLAGFTHGKKYIKLASDDILLVDTPGVIPFYDQSEVELVIKCAIRPDKIVHLLDSVAEILSLIDEDNIKKKYGILYENTKDFLEKITKKRGKLLPGGIADIQTVAKLFINDFQRGRLPYYKKPQL